MELQIFPFFVLAFFALTDGAPRKMNGSIDMTKPEHAKADLARARRDESWEVIEPASEEAAHWAEYALNYENEYPDRFIKGDSTNPYILVKIVLAQKKQACSGCNVNYRVDLVLKEEDWVDKVVFCPITFWGPGFDGKEFEMLDYRCTFPHDAAIWETPSMSKRKLLSI